MTNSVAETGNQKSKAVNKIWRGVIILFALIGAYNMFFSGRTDVAKPSAAPTASAPPDAVAVDAASSQPSTQAESTPARPSHNYSLHENGEYGYEPGISEDERKRGVATKPLLMVSYLGEDSGLYTVYVHDGPQRMVASCEAPCEFIRIKVVIAGETVSEERVRNSPGSLIGSVMEDAMAGQLIPYKSATKAIAKSHLNETKEDVGSYADIRMRNK